MNIFSAAQGKDNLTKESPQNLLSKILDRKFQKTGELIKKIYLKIFWLAIYTLYNSE